MIPYLNFAVLILSSILFTYFYVKSVSPAALARRIGPAAYAKCSAYRVIASIFMLIASVNYLLYYWFPLPLPFARTFPWSYPLSAAIAVLIAIPSFYLVFRGVKDAGEETIRPRREHEMYGGIYTKIRHPQAVGELPLWWVFAFLLHSPFLALFSFVYVPVWVYFCIAEERDLLIRYGEAYESYRQETGFWLPKKERTNGGNPQQSG